MATTFLFSTRSRTAAAERDESEPSSTWNSLTGWQLTPPRELMSATQTCMPTRAGRRTLLTIPENPPTCPRTSGEPALAHPLPAAVPPAGVAVVTPAPLEAGAAPGLAGAPLRATADPAAVATPPALALAAGVLAAGRVALPDGVPVAAADWPPVATSPPVAATAPASPG